MNTEKINQYHKLLQLLEQGVVSAANQADPHVNIRSMLEKVGNLFSCRRVYIYEKNADGDYIKWDEWNRAGTKPSPDVFSSDKVKTFIQTFTALTRADILELDNLEMVRNYPEIYAELKKKEVHSGYFALLKDHNEICGFTGVENPQWEDQTAMFSIFHICSEIAKAGMQNRMNLEKAVRNGLVDPLTGLHNRMALTLQLADYSHDLSMGILYADVTGLKETNDRYGHEAGDKLLKKTASVLKQVFTSADTYRIGGDEFLVVCNGISEKEFNAKNYAMNRLLEKENVILATGAVFENPWKTDFDLLLKMADARMYETKRRWYSAKETSSSDHGKDEDLALILEIYVNQGIYQILYKNTSQILNPPSFGKIEDLLCLTIEKAVHPQDAEAFKSFCNPDLLKKRALENDIGSAEMQKEFRFSSIDGKWNWMRISFILSNADDTDFRVLCLVRNLSRQDHMAMLRKREEGDETDLIDALTGMHKEPDLLRQINVWLAEHDSEHTALVYFKIRRLPFYIAVFSKEDAVKNIAAFNRCLDEFIRRLDGIYGYLGRDEFLAAVRFDGDEHKLKETIENWLKGLDSPNGFEPAAGIAVRHDPDMPVAELYNQAVMSGQSLQDTHTRLTVLYDDRLFKKVRDEQRLIRDIEEAMHNGELTFYLQPKVNMENGKVVSAEALMRWIHNGHIIPPDDYIPLLEREERIYPLDLYIWDKVFAFQKELLNSGMRVLPISVNVSQKDIKAGNVVQDFIELKKKYGFEISPVDIEITESAFAGNALVRDVSVKLSNAGFRILMDDFGKGYSSLTAFGNMPVDILKIDKKFVDSLLSDQKDEEIVSLIIRMAHMVGIHVVVEGVETRDQVKKMLSLNCHYAQGYYFYHPMPQNDFIHLINDVEKVQYDPDASGRLSVGVLDFAELIRSQVLDEKEINNVTGALSIWQVIDTHLVLIQMNEAYANAIGYDFGNISPDQNVSANIEVKANIAVENFHKARRTGHEHVGSWYLRPGTKEKIYLEADIYPLNKRLNGDLYLVQFSRNSI